MKKISCLAGLIPLLCNPVSAIELGDLSANSGLNEPFRAVLTINDASDLEWADVRFKMANDAMYQRFGMQAPTNLRSVKFELVPDGNGRYQLHLSSQQRVDDPILHLLIQVEETQGSFFREYTLLLDPPFAPQPQQSTQASSPVAALVDTESTSPPTHETADDVLAGRTIQVRNKSISIIAEQSELHPKYSVYQIMRALYLANRWAFDHGNINKLISGSRLVVPDESVIGEVPRQKAINFVYSVSRDSKQNQASNMADAQKQAPATRPTPQITASPPPQAKSDRATQAAPATLDSDVATWRSMADEFGALSAIVDHQNSALRTQTEAIKDLYRNVDTQQRRIVELTTQLGHLQQQASADAAPPASAIEMPTPMPQIEQSGPMPQENEIHRLTELLREREQQIRELNNRLLEQSQPIVLEQEAAVAAVTTQRLTDIPPAAPIVTYVETPAERPASSWWLRVALSLAVLLFALREWSWRRRVATREEQLPDDEDRPTTYSPSNDPENLGTLELRHLETRSKKEKNKDMTEVSRSQLRLESDSMEEVRVEIEVLMAYEQYEEAMSLLGLSQQKFGESAWIDSKQLEILAATNQCEAFLNLFNEKRAALEAASPIMWDKMQKMRDQLCSDFRISALG